MKLREVQWHKKTKSLSQISNTGLEYAFVSTDYRQIHQLVWCKDFLQDAVYGMVNNKRVSIYGFSYDPSVDAPLHMESTRLLLASRRDKTFKKKIFNSLEFINKIEKSLKMTPTQIEQCMNPPAHYKSARVYIFDGSKRWMKAPPMISLYSLLIRVGLVHEPGDTFKKTLDAVRTGDRAPYYSYDKGFLVNAKKALDLILKNGDRKIFHPDIRKNYPESIGSTDTVHNSFGIVGFASGSTKYYCPRWHKLEKNS